jgi:EAL domain-containing protein (putative c-di-GMP-specific phosphodiesterase class I)
VGLIGELTRLVLDLALGQLVSLDGAGHLLEMRVNLSRLDLVDPSLPAFVEALLARHDVAPGRLTLEVTESCLGDDPELAHESIVRLRAAGIRVAIDDFGVGYSSMSQLLELPVDELKVDKSFVLAMSSDERAKAVVRATVDVARALGLTTVAEGIEDSATLLAVQAMGVDVAQGYFLGCPFTYDQLVEYLRDPATIVEREAVR